MKKIGHGYKPAGQYDKLYTIESGNTLYNIAKQELGGNPTHQEINARVAEIARVNNITNVNVIKVGQKIRLTKLGKQMEIPKAGESSEKSSTEKVTTPTVDFPGEDGTIEGNLKNYTNQFIADALKETSFDISTTNNNDGTKTKNIRLNDDRWIKATYDSSGNITKIEINVDSNSDYSNEALTSDIIVNKDLMQYSTRPQATSLDKSFQEGFKFEEFVAAFEAIESQAEKSAKTEPKKEVTDEKKDGTEQAQVEIHTAKDNKGKEFKASNETILKQFIQEINNPDKDKIEIFEKYSKSHDSELINSMIENDMLKDVVWHSTKPEEMISSILTPENAKNFSQKSLENITNLCQYFKYHDLQKKLNELNPLNKKFSSGELTKDDLENAEKTKLVSTFEHEGIKVYNHNDKFYKVTDNKVEEVPFAEAKAIELSSDLSSRAFDKWYGSDENPNITTDNIVEIVTKFKELNNEGIITALDNKTGGPGVEQMRKLINTLLEKAKNLGLENYDSYKEISKFSTRNMYIGVGGDYAFGRAKQIDKEIDHLIELIELTNKNN